MPMLSFIQQFGVLFLGVVIISFLTKILRQPILVGYVLSGILFSLFLGEGFIAREQMGIFSELGITFLLFLMGLEFDLKSLKYFGKDIFFATILQSAIFFAVSFGVVSFFPFPIQEKLLLSLLFMFSSTLLVAKLVEDNRETGTLHGKIILGTLIVQDVMEIMVLSFMGTIATGNGIAGYLSPLGGFLLLGIAIILAKYILNFPLKVASKFPELLFITSLGVCFLFVLIASLLKFPITIGAFVGGVTLANTIYKTEILSRLKPLILFFNMLFFVTLGFQADVALGSHILIVVAIFSILSLVVKPIVYFITFLQRGYDYRVSFLAGISMAQLSEFGFIIIGSAVGKGIASKEIEAAAIIAVLLSMVLSSYLMKFDKRLFRLVKPLIFRVGKAFAKKDRPEFMDITSNVLFFGSYQLNKELYQKLIKMGKKAMFIVNDPEIVEQLYREKIPCIYNSVNNPEFFGHIHFEHVELVVSGLTDVEDNKAIIRELRNKNPTGVAIVTAKSLKDSLELYDLKADYVLYPAFINERQVSVLLEDYTTDINKVIAKKVFDISELKRREQEQMQFEVKSGFSDINSFLHKILSP